ncbi:cytochrome P450 [Streptomyces sp. NPDC059788]|uniref:cytochrome P450 n=1 Tax=Streptomyces sp. NPDC059788 TaxID=3346948 RepID=UPI00364686ED
MTEALPFPQDRTCPYHPPAAYQPLRDARPLSRVTLYDGRTAWVVTRHAEARALLTDPRMSANRQNPGYPAFSPGFEMLRQVRTPLLGVDDPEHNMQRRMLISSFTLKRATAMRPRIHEIVDGLLDTVEKQGPTAELVSAFTLPVPSMVICSLLGVPYEDHKLFEGLSCTLLQSSDPQEVAASQARLTEYFTGLVARKQEEPGEGLLDELIAERLTTGEMSHVELVHMAMLLLVAGHETTSNMLSLGIFTLLEHPEQFAALRADASLIPDAVEELMRYLSIADGMARVAAEDIEVDGETIRAGDGVVFLTSLVNRDAAVYDSPESLDWERSSRQHISFGFGVHQCLGANLARATMEIAFEALFARFPDLRLAVPAAEVPAKPGYTLQGLVELPVTW